MAPHHNRTPVERRDKNVPTFNLNDLTEKRYDEYVGSFLASVGEAYGMRMLGEYANGPKFTAPHQMGTRFGRRRGLAAVPTW